MSDRDADHEILSWLKGRMSLHWWVPEEEMLAAARILGFEEETVRGVLPSVPVREDSVDGERYWIREGADVCSAQLMTNYCVKEDSIEQDR